MSGEKWNLVIDVARCNNCCNCVIAAKDEHVGNSFPGYAAEQPKLGHRWIDVETIERGVAPVIDVVHVPRLCNHCDDAPCIKAGGGAVSKRPDGIVLIDPVKARGRRDLVDACPYGAVWWNEGLQLPQMWIFDAHLLDQGWAEPRCVRVCPTEAIRAVKCTDEAMADTARRLQLDVLKAELGTKPRVYYRNLARALTAFIGGQVVVVGSDGRQECAEGARIRIEGGSRVFETRTDVFGDYCVDGLPLNSGPYTVTATFDGHPPAAVHVDVKHSVVAPMIVITRELGRSGLLPSAAERDDALS